MWITLQNRLATEENETLIVMLYIVYVPKMWSLFVTCFFSAIIRLRYGVGCCNGFDQPATCFEEESRTNIIKVQGEEPAQEFMLCMFSTEAIYVICTQMNRKIFVEDNISTHMLVKEILFNTACNGNEDERSHSI